MYGLPNREQRRCPTDGAPCDLFQPDESRPCRLLLVCPDCGRWILLEGFHQADADAPTWRELVHHFAPIRFPTRSGEMRGKTDEPVSPSTNRSPGPRPPALT